MTARLIAHSQLHADIGGTMEDLVAYCARVSNPTSQAAGQNVRKLLDYMIEHAHWSPFEMASVVVEVETTRDIARQLLRHRSFTFQEFCVSGDTLITLELPGAKSKGKRAAYKRSIAHLYRLQETGKKMPKCVRVFDEHTRSFTTARIREVFQTGIKPLFRITLANGKQIECTKEHKLLTENGFVAIEDAIGLKVIGSTAVFEKPCAIACNGVPAYRDVNWLAAAKRRSIDEKTGLSGIAAEAQVTTHTIRKALKKHGLQFTRREVASYCPAWNKGVGGYSLGRHSPETIEKMRASARKGPASNLWKGGADRRERIRIADWCNSHRTDFLRNANYMCNRCGSNVRLELHHIEPVSMRPDLAYDFNNIEVLCRCCHHAHHTISGHRKEWRAKSIGRTLTVSWSPVAKVEFIGEEMTYDLEVEHTSHNYIANGIVTHNSQRYAEAPSDFVEGEVRMKHPTNRQSSLKNAPKDVEEFWAVAQGVTAKLIREYYDSAIGKGIAPEVARKILPEGMTRSRLYVHGTIRSWMHYIDVRTRPDTQLEHRELARDCAEAIELVFPMIMQFVHPEAE